MLEHLADLRTLALPHGDGIDSHDFLEVVFRYFICRFDHSTYASIVDRVIQPSKFLYRFLYTVINGFLIGDVDFERFDRDIW